MKVIAVSSPAPAAGKTTAIVALGERLRLSGVKVDYRRLPGPGADADASFVAAALRLGETARRVARVAELRHASVDADVVLVEDAAESPIKRPDLSWLDEVSVRLLVVARYQAEGLVDSIRRRALGWPADGTAVLVNAVPDKGIRPTHGRVFPVLREHGFSILGAIPQDRVLLGLTVGELAERLGAKVLCAQDQLELPVEAVMISAMSDEGAEAYFRRIARKAVVAGGDRPDIHMPALATDTSCIVLTEGFDPDPTVFKTAEELGVPLLKVSPSTVETLEQISAALAAARFRQRHKSARAVPLFAAHVADDEIGRALGLLGQGVRP